MSPSRFGRLGRLLCLGGAALGALGLIGWFTGASALTTIVPGQPPMMANTAVGLLAIGLAGALRQPKDAGRVRRAVSLLLAFVVLALSIGTLAEYALATDLGIDQLRLLIDLADPSEEQKAKWLAQIAAWHLHLQKNEEKFKAALDEIIRDYPQTAQAFAAQRRLYLLEMGMAQK